MSLFLISQAYSISDDEYEATKGSEVQIKDRESNINSGSHCKSGNAKGRKVHRPTKQLKPKNPNKSEKKNAVCETSPNLFEEWPFTNESITTSEKMDGMENENEDKIFTSSFLNLLDEMENKAYEKLTVEKQIVAKKPPSTKKRGLENNRLIVSVNSRKDVKFEVCDKIQQKKSLAPNQCIMCYKQFPRSSHLERHMLTHTKEKRFSCKVCDESFAHLSNLKSHKNVHTDEKPFHCKICNKKFADSSNLKVHKRIHTGEKPFRCSVCSASFSHSGTLRTHKRAHTGERPYQCTICSKRFAQLSNLRSHQPVHTKEKPFECLLCGKKFAWRDTFKRHTQSHNIKN